MINEIGILKSAISEALAKNKLEEPPTVQRSAFAKAYRKELKSLRRANHSAERVVELYMEAVAMQGIPREAINQYRAMIVDVIDKLEPGWFLSKRRQKPALHTGVAKPKIVESVNKPIAPIPAELPHDEENTVAAPSEYSNIEPPLKLEDEPYSCAGI